MTKWRSRVYLVIVAVGMALSPWLAAGQPPETFPQRVWVNPGVSVPPPANMQAVILDAGAIVLADLVATGSEWRQEMLFSTLTFQVNEVLKDASGRIVPNQPITIFSVGGEYQPGAQPIVTRLSEEAELYRVDRRYVLPISWDQGWDFWYVRYASAAAFDVTDRLVMPIVRGTALARDVTAGGFRLMATDEFLSYMRRASSAPRR